MATASFNAGTPFGTGLVSSPAGAETPPACIDVGEKGLGVDAAGAAEGAADAEAAVEAGGALQ